MRKVIQTDTLIIGAGVIGSSVAMHLAKLGAGEIRVIDFDLEGTLSSSELNAGGVRATWNQPLNIEMSKFTIDYLATVGEDVGYRACGYLWLHPAERLPAALKARELQTASGWEVQAWDVAELRSRVPFIDKTDGIAGAVFAPRDGLVNPNLLKNHFRAEARQRGVNFDDRTLLRGVSRDSSGFSVRTEHFPSVLSHEFKVQVFAGAPAHAAGFTEVEYRAKRVVNCAGPWAGRVAEMLGYKSPSQPVRRQICIFDCRDVDLTPYGMIVDTSGVYFHPEATNGLAGFANHGEPHGVNYDYSPGFFEESIWPALYERASGFERLKHLTGWAGLYEISPDESAIIGAAYAAPAGTFEAHSFSGHGVMHSHAAGLALAELMTHGKYRTMDASPLSGERFVTGKLVQETLII